MARVHKAIDDGVVFVSAAVAWEIEIKKRLGKLQFPDNFQELSAGEDFRDLPVTIVHAIAAGRLPLHHRDPFDRLLIGQAQCERLTIVTGDVRFKAYDVDLILA